MLHTRLMRSIEWLTTTIVLPSRCIWRTRARHFFWNASSPTASTSSTSRMSGSRLTATENPSRTNMPDE